MRTFVAVYKNGEKGRFQNKEPRLAAIKAAKPLLKKKKKVDVTIRESTRNSKKKEYNYTVSKKKIPIKKAKELKEKLPYAPKFEYSVKPAK